MSRKKIKDLSPVSAKIDSLNFDGRGVCRVEGKVVFVENALEGEQVLFKYRKRKKDYDEAYSIEIENPNENRIEPKCKLFGICGGCSLQHLNYEAQKKHKQTILLETLQKIGNTKPKEILPVIASEPFSYRRRARLGIRYDKKKDKIYAGFREKQSSFIVEADSCPILSPPLDNLLPEIRSMIAKLSAFDKIPQLEYAKADNIAAVVLRHLAPLSEDDISILKDFGLTHQIQIYLQPAGLNSIHCISENPVDLYYEIPQFKLKIYFQPADFIQVNSNINLKLIDKAVEFLEPGKDDSILDLFCGIGNFSLCLAHSGAKVNGVEGESSLCTKASMNAEKNALSANCRFFHSDLFKNIENQEWTKEHYNKILLDPPRSGAFEIVKNIDLWMPEKICYISCNPATLARDAAVLKEKGYSPEKAASADMFPQTAHSEAITLFIRNKK